MRVSPIFLGGGVFHDLRNVFKISGDFRAEPILELVLLERGGCSKSKSWCYFGCPVVADSDRSARWDPLFPI